MKKINVKDLVFWVVFTMMLFVTMMIYIDGTANAVEETVVETEETNVNRWVCGDYADAYMKARRYANDIHTEHVCNERKLIGIDYDDYLEAYSVCFQDVRTGSYYFRYFYN